MPVLWPVERWWTEEDFIFHYKIHGTNSSSEKDLKEQILVNFVFVHLPLKSKHIIYIFCTWHVKSISKHCVKCLLLEQNAIENYIIFIPSFHPKYFPYGTFWIALPVFWVTCTKVVGDKKGLVWFSYVQNLIAGK